MKDNKDSKPAPSGQRGDERRRSARLPCRTPVRVYADSCPASESFTLLGSGLSQDGVFLHSDFLLTVGEMLEIEFLVPGQPFPVRGAGRVVRVDPGREGAGMAVRLDGTAE